MVDFRGKFRYNTVSRNERRCVAVRKKRIGYAILFLLILVTEVLIALFVRDRFIRPYGGDVLVTVLICCFLRIFFPERPVWLPAAVFVFAAAVEAGQYFDFVSLLGLGHIPFFRILLGSTFSIPDLLCYLAGCLLFAMGEYILCKRK
ncbi:MAG: DUF2809 domain-containing protein [Clostridia bacterium]|nr:DUF2809 domain-containing protein [Clostridia bacterium]